MSNEDNSSYNDTLVLSREIAIPRLVRFWIMLIFYIPSLICSLFVLYHFIFNRTLRQALHNHAITLLLIINLIVQLTSIPWILNYYRLGSVWPQSSIYCLIWIIIDEGLYITTTLLFAWVTIERHILIFHDQLVATKKKFILFHCCPVVILLLYCFCYTIIVVIVPPCENIFDYTQLVCGYRLCYYGKESLVMWDVIFNQIIPTIIIISCSIGLLLRILYQKSRMRQPIRWRTHRKMTIQMMSISVLYLVVYIPGMLVEFIHLCGVSEEVGADFAMYAQSFMYYGDLLLPFICAGSMPELEIKIKRMFPCYQRQMRVIAPQALTMSRPVAAQQVNKLTTVGI